MVAPLISLMKDQAGKLDDAGVAATLVNTTLNKRDEAAAIQGIVDEQHEFVFATPERLANPAFFRDTEEQHHRSVRHR